MVQIGAALPITSDEHPAESLAAVAENAERMGLGSLWTYERLMRPTEAIPMGGPGGPVMDPPEAWAATYDPLEALTYVAATTQRILLGTSVLAALFHSPVVLARRLATLDRLASGRLLAGVGQSWMAQEFTATNIPMRRRGRGFEEHLAVMRTVWGANPVEYAGQHYRVPAAEIGPKPFRAGGPTVLVGAAAPAAVERAGRLGFGLAMVSFSWDGLRESISTFRNAAAGAGHDPDLLPMTVQVNGPLTVDGPVDDRAPFTGAVEQVADDLVALDRLGVDHIYWAMLDPAEQLDILGRLSEAYAQRT